jgi:hypothetical protein
MLDGATLEFTVRVPTVELALVIKALAYGSRLQARDIEDIGTTRNTHRLPGHAVRLTT